MIAAYYNMVIENRNLQKSPNKWTPKETAQSRRNQAIVTFSGWIALTVKDLLVGETLNGAPEMPLGTTRALVTTEEAKLLLSWLAIGEAIWLVSVKESLTREVYKYENRAKAKSICFLQTCGCSCEVSSFCNFYWMNVVCECNLILSLSTIPNFLCVYFFFFLFHMGLLIFSYSLV